MKNIFKVLGLVENAKKHLIYIVLLAIISGGVGASVPLLIQNTAKKAFALASNPDLGILTLLSAVGFYVLVRTFSIFITDRLVAYEGQKLTWQVLHSLRSLVASRLQYLSFDFYSKTRTGEIVERISSSTREVSSWASGVSSGIAPSVAYALAAMVIIGLKAPLALAWIIAVMPLIYFLRKQRSKKRMPLHRQGQEYFEQAIGQANETISQIEQIRSLGLEGMRHKQFVSLHSLQRKTRLKQFDVTSKYDVAISLANLLMYSGAILLLSLIIRSGGDVTDLLVLAIYLNWITDAIYAFGNAVNLTEEADVAAEKILKILGENSKISDPAIPLEISNIESIEFRNVTYTHEGKASASLKDLSFTIGKGQSVALVGRSGAGKSTVIRLILRIYDPEAGEILINGNDIKEYAQEDVRRLAGVVLQDVALFNDSVANNIAVTDPDASISKIESAAKVAHIHEFISALPKGYETLVGERGIKLSGGEKQRVSIARAVLRNPEIILLDEATSALDSESEKFVQDGLKKLLKDRTAVIIAHRLSTIAHADKIVVLDKGKIVEQGTFEELKKSGGAFANLLDHQKL